MTLQTRARLGLIVPPNNTVNEAEWQLALPPGVSMHATRMRLNPLARSEEEMAVLCQDLRDAAALMGEAPVDVVTFGCTAPSAVNPRAEMEALITEASGKPGVTAAAAVVDALLTFKARRIVLVSPFSTAVTQHEAQFLHGEGIEVLDTASLGHQTYAPGRQLGIHLIDGDAIRKSIEATRFREADAILLSGTNMVTFPHIATMEEVLERPIVSSNQAMFWSALRRAGIADVLPFGRLFTAQ